jgi:large conductance mechanosensitive channel
MRSVLQGFKAFIMRGNVMELAVALVIGAAFTGLINAIVSGLFNPLIAAIFGQNSLVGVGSFTVNGAAFRPGAVLDALIKFLVIAAAVYFAIVLPLNAFAERRKKGFEPEPTKPGEDILLLQQIRDLLASQSPPSATAGTAAAEREAAAQAEAAAQDALTGRRPSTGAHAALAPLDALRKRSDQPVAR